VRSLRWDFESLARGVSLDNPIRAAAKAARKYARGRGIVQRWRGLRTPPAPRFRGAGGWQGAACSPTSTGSGGGTKLDGLDEAAFRDMEATRRNVLPSRSHGATCAHISSIGEIGVTATELPKASCRWVMANAEPLCGSREAVNAAHGSATPSDWAPTHPAGQPIRIGSHSADGAEFTPTRPVDPELTPRDRGADVVVRHMLTAPNAEVTKTASRTNSSRSLSPIRPHTKLTLPPRQSSAPSIRARDDRDPQRSTRSLTGR
jgi:hypothetical protein